MSPFPGICELEAGTAARVAHSLATRIGWLAAQLKKADIGRAYRDVRFGFLGTCEKCPFYGAFSPGTKSRGRQGDERPGRADCLRS